FLGISDYNFNTFAKASRGRRYAIDRLFRKWLVVQKSSSVRDQSDDLTPCGGVREATIQDHLLHNPT
ncbi:hypothetical protein FOPG_19453, partial [Fusarium oxysporum f. sp. conglutinans race 2 54008]